MYLVIIETHRHVNEGMSLVLKRGGGGIILEQGTHREKERGGIMYKIGMYEGLGASTGVPVPDPFPLI